MASRFASGGEKRDGAVGARAGWVTDASGDDVGGLDTGVAADPSNALGTRGWAASGIDGSEMGESGRLETPEIATGGLEIDESENGGLDSVEADTGNGPDG